MHRILSLARIPWVSFLLLAVFFSSSSTTSSSRTVSSYFCFPTSLVECVASALTHCQKERGLSQWLACMYREEEEADEDEEEREEEEEDNDNDDDEEETITIEGVCPLRRRRCSSILFLVDASLVRLCCPCSTLLIFLPTFCPLVSDQSSRWPFCVRCAGGEGENNRRKCRGRKGEPGSIHGLFTGLADRKIN